MSDLLAAAKRLLHLHACEQEGLSAGQPTPEQWTEAVEALSDAVESRQKSRQSGAVERAKHSAMIGKLRVEYPAMIGKLSWDACDTCFHYQDDGCTLATGRAVGYGFVYTDGDYAYCKDYKARGEGGANNDPR